MRSLDVLRSLLSPPRSALSFTAVSKQEDREGLRAEEPACSWSCQFDAAQVYTYSRLPGALFSWNVTDS